MTTTLKLKTILAASLALLIISCSNNKSKKTKTQEITLVDIKQEEEPPPPPPPPPPPKELVALNKCYSNQGLKYATTIKIGYNNIQVAGLVSNVDIETGGTLISTFSGT